MEFKDTTIDLTEIASELVPTEGIIIDSFNSMHFLVVSYINPSDLA